MVQHVMKGRACSRKQEYSDTFQGIGVKLLIGRIRTYREGEMPCLHERRYDVWLR